MLTRFAPAPTGVLHLGHVASAIHVWGLAARHGAAVLLRIEDHDRQRSRPAFETQLLDDLDWLGFAPDRFTTSEFRAGRCDGRQSDRRGIYEQIALDWISQGLVYGCTCSRRGQAETADTSSDGRCPGTCRIRAIALTDQVAWRVRLEPGAESFDDLILGAQTSDPSLAFGDPVIRDRRGNWTYQFAVSVDDFLQEVDFVVRGRDLLASTGLQIRLARLAGRRTTPLFAHHPLIMKSSSQKLSKSDGDSGIRELRAAGWSAARVIGEAAWRVELIRDPRPVEARDVGPLFDGRY